MKADPGHISANASAAGAVPCFKLEIWWSSGYVDETTYLLIGSSGSSSLLPLGEGLLGLGGPSGAMANLSLDNSTGRYSALHSGSMAAIYGLYGKPVRLSAGYVHSGTPEYVVVFTGRVTGISESERAATVQLQCSGMESMYEQQKLSTPMYTALRTDEWIATIANALGIGSMSLEKGHTIIPYCFLDDDFGLAEIRAAAQAEGGCTFFDDSGTLQFWRATHWCDLTSVATFDMGSRGELQPDTDRVNVANIVGVEYQARQEVEPVCVFRLDRPVMIPPGKSRTLTLKFQLPLVSFTGYTLRATSGGQDISSSVSVMPSSPQWAASWQVTFTNTNSRLAAWLMAFDVWGTPAAGRPSEEFVSDQSGSDVDRRRDVRGNPNIQTEPQARMLASILTQRLKTPRLSVKLTDMPANPLLERGDLITVRSTLTGLNRVMMVTGIDWRKAQSYRMNISAEDMSGFYPYSPFWKVGTSYLGAGGGRLVW